MLLGDSHERRFVIFIEIEIELNNVCFASVQVLYISKADILCIYVVVFERNFNGLYS
jgi:hypothetical protein